MARKENSTLTQKFQALSLLLSGSTYRVTAKEVGIPKSTLHDNLGKFASAIDSLRDTGKNGPQRFLVRAALSLCLICKSSARDCALTISSLFGVHISHQTILRILTLSAECVRPLQDGIGLDRIESVACDEIFQKSRPILGVIDLNSAYLKLGLCQDRSGDSWIDFLSDLKDQGLSPESATIDGGQGMTKGLKEVFPLINLNRDLFHVLRKLEKALRKIEGTCYALIAQVDKKPDDHALRTKQDLSIEQFDILFGLVPKLRLAAYLSSSFASRGEGATKADLGTLIDKICQALSLFACKVSGSRVVREALSYLKNGKPQILAYKALIDSHSKSCFGEQHAHLAREFLMPMAERISHYQGTYEDREKSERLGKEIAELRAAFRVFPFCQEEVDRAINEATKIYAKTHKASSLIECVNSVIRRHLHSYKSIPSWFPDLFTFYWNFRRFKRGKRRNYAPVELMTGKTLQGDWLELILDRFPYEKLRKGIDMESIPLGLAA